MLIITGVKDKYKESERNENRAEDKHKALTCKLSSGTDLDCFSDARELVSYFRENTKAKDTKNFLHITPSKQKRKKHVHEKYNIYFLCYPRISSSDS